MSGETKGDAAVTGSGHHILITFLLNITLSRSLITLELCIHLGYWRRGWPRREPSSAPEPLSAQMRDGHSTVTS